MRSSLLVSVRSRFTLSQDKMEKLPGFDSAYSNEIFHSISSKLQKTVVDIETFRRKTAPSEFRSHSAVDP